MSRNLPTSALMILFVGLAMSANGQERILHYPHTGPLPAGTVGQGQLTRLVMLRGHVQPVELQVPKGSRLSIVVDGQFDDPRPGPVVAGFQVGSVYQLMVSGIAFEPGLEVFPTLEIINRLYPPPGMELRFPVQVQITQEDLDLALSGRFVTRVIYLEDPETALAHADEPGYQRHFDVGASEDPLRTADRLGRPMAILRLGSRVPDIEAGQTGLGFASAPVILYTAEERNPENSNNEDAIERQQTNIPRVPLRGNSPTYPVGLNR